SGQLHVFEAVVVFLETDFELVAALHLDLDRRPKLPDPGGDQSGGGDTRAARQSLAFDTALEGADAHVARAEDLHKIDIRAFWSEVRMPPDLRAELLHHGPVRIRHE